LFAEAHVLGCISAASYLLTCDNTTQREVNVTYKTKQATIQLHCPTSNARADEPFSGRVPKLSINIKETLSRAHGNFEDRNKVLGVFRDTNTNTNNNNNYYYYLLQLGCYPVAEIILHVNKT